MNVIRSQLLKAHPEAIETFGYVTKENRMALGLEKSHITAFPFKLESILLSETGKRYQQEKRHQK